MKHEIEVNLWLQDAIVNFLTEKLQEALFEKYNIRIYPTVVNIDQYTIDFKYKQDSEALSYYSIEIADALRSFIANDIKIVL